MVSYSLAVNPLRRHFWTCSVWADHEAMVAFTREEPHAGAAGRYEAWAGAGAAFLEWESAESKLDWSEAFARLKVAQPR